MPTKIEWTQEIWNPITGCTKVSEGCRNCYAERMARRLAGRFGYPEAPHQFDVTLHPDKLDVPLRRKKPTTYFVCSMSDLFHEDIPDDFICDVFYTMYQSPQHTFQVLTKRPRRVLDWFNRPNARDSKWHEPLPNVWLGVSVENQATADEHLPLLLQTPAAVRFVSCEPLLEAVDLTRIRVSSMEMLDALTGKSTVPHSEPPKYPGLDWVIVGGESGPGARPMHPGWARSVRDQCQAAGIPFFFKQWGRWLPAKEPSRGYFEGAHLWGDGWSAIEVGKKAAGRLLDGREWNEMPETGG